MTDEDEFDKAFEGFGDDEPKITPPVADPATPPPADPPKVDPPLEEPKKDEEQPKPPVDPAKPIEEEKPPASDEKKPEEGAETPKAPEAPVEPIQPEAPKPLTLDDIKGVINEVRTEERTSGQALESATKEVLDAYYPDGLSNTLVDQATGKELKTPQDVVDVTNGQMTTEEAAQWLINEQFKLDQDVNRIRNDAQKVAETTLKFKQDAVEVLQRYEPVFKVYPQLQEKVWNQYNKLVKADVDKGVILSAPDMRDYYDLVLEPYRLAVEYKTGEPGTAPAPPAPAAPAPPAPGIEDRLDEGGDGGTSPVNDPNDFAQQVKKELAREF